MNEVLLKALNNDAFRYLEKFAIKRPRSPLCLYCIVHTSLITLELLLVNLILCFA